MSVLEQFVGNMSIAELAGRTGKSVQEIVAFAFDDASLLTRGSGSLVVDETGRAAKGRSSRTSVVNTRTAEGRAAYDEAILRVLADADSPIGATAIRSEVGGTGLQVRTSLNRLIEEGKVTYEGKARATRYALAD